MEQTHNEVDLIIKNKIKKPAFYHIILLNDDYTTMDFVISILTEIFNKSITEAKQLMLKIHFEGQAICGTYSKDIAETKIETVYKKARMNSFPLQCILEKA